MTKMIITRLTNLRNVSLKFKLSLNITPEFRVENADIAC